MRRFSAVMMVLVTILLISCYRNTDNISGKNLIPSKDLVNILTDIHMGTAILNISEISRRYGYKDTATNFVEIIGKYGYTKEQMDNTMKYYFINKPKQLQVIYDKVLSNLSATESDLDAELKSSSEAARNLWEGNATYSLQGTEINESVWFDVPAQDTGTYELSATIILFGDDQSNDPGITAYFWKDDGTTEGVKDNWERVSFIKDGERHEYSLSKKLTDTSFTRIRGWLLYNAPQEGIWEKHINAEAISITRQ